MMNGTNGMLIDPMQSMRISEYPIKIEENLIVYDNLEAGTLRIYEQMDGPVNVQQLFTRYNSVKNALLIAELVINSNWKSEGVFIHRIFCENGYEYLVNPMVEHILHFADFYDCYNTIGISDNEYEKWFPIAKETLSKFQKNNRTYEYSLLDV